MSHQHDRSCLHRNETMYDAFYGPEPQMASLQITSPPHAFGVVNKEISWLKRLWFLVSNPFLYVLTGKIRW